MIQLYLMGIIYTILGIIHFTHTGFYRSLMPKFLPAHDLLIYLSGVAVPKVKITTPTRSK